MKTYARLGCAVDKSANPLDSSKWVNSYYVAEIIPPITYEVDSPEGVQQSWKQGDEIPIGQRYTPELVGTMVDITSVTPQPQQNWTYDGKAFSAPLSST